MSTGWPLIGRAEEFALLRQAIAPGTGNGGIVLAGVAGVGKSRLARDAVDEARRRNRPAHWVCATGSSRSVPLGAFVQFTTSLSADPLLRVRDVIAALTKSRPGGITVVGVDDAHLLDDQSALVVQQLVITGAATVIVTIRSGEAVPDAILSLYKDHGLPRMELQPLSASDVASLLETALDGEVESASAQRIWRYTRGNVLYLRQLISDELAQGQLVRRNDLWVWTGNPAVSPTLLELIEHNIGRHPADIVDVLDAVAIAEPVELPVLKSLSRADAIEAAEAQGLIVIDGDDVVARLAHPMFGEARRRLCTAVRRAELSRRLAGAIAELCPASPHQVVRRAVLTAESGELGDGALFTEAAAAALQLLDVPLAVRLADKAIECGGDVPARLMHAMTVVTGGGALEGDRLLLDLAEVADDVGHQATIGMFRAANLGWNLSRPIAAGEVLDAAQDAAAACGLAESYDGLRVSLLAARGHAAAAAQLVAEGPPNESIHAVAAMFRCWGAVIAHGDLGHLDRLHEAAATGYRVATSASEAAHLRFGMGMMHVDGLRLAGALDDASTVAAQLHRQVRDVPFALAMTTMIMGCAEMARGDLDVAQRWLREAIANSAGSNTVASDLGGVWLAFALAMTGQHAAARDQLRDTADLTTDGFVLWEPHRRLAEAWVDAGDGSLTAARQQAREAADMLRGQGRPAREVWCLQTATQFGDTTTASRLTQLAAEVQGPRVTAAATHADALARTDGDALLSASRLYEDFGDRLAAADAAAQAVTAFRDRGARGSALSAASVAARLAERCGAATPALRAVTMPTVLTPRQVEIVSLVAAGLSTREIAERLVMSVRSVEGHLFRASRRTGLTSRAELVALLEGGEFRNH